jgi:alpha-galactosidase/6-phospho-beta-glucosidase family protein
VNDINLVTELTALVNEAKQVVKENSKTTRIDQLARLRSAINNAQYVLNQLGKRVPDLKDYEVLEHFYERLGKRIAVIRSQGCVEA